MSLSAGRLRHRIEIQRRVQTQNVNTGLVSKAWTPQWTNVPAAVEFLSARELIAAQAVQSQIVARITVRYRDGLDASMRIVYRGQYYDIAGVMPDKDSGREYLTLPVSVGVNDG